MPFVLHKPGKKQQNSHMSHDSSQRCIGTTKRLVGVPLIRSTLCLWRDDRRQPENAESKSLICSVEIYAGSIYRERAYGYRVAPRKMYTDSQH